MRMILLPFALLVAGHAHAQNRAAAPPPTAERVGDALSSPVVQAGVAGLVAAFADAMLDTRVGPIARYTDPRDGIRAGDTLGDLVRRDDPHFDARLQQRTRSAVAVAGQLTKDGAAVAGELGATAARLRGLIEGTAALVEAYSDGD